MSKPDDAFQFVFSQIDALEAVADDARRRDLVAAFGIPDSEVVANEWSFDTMDALGWCFDSATGCWVPNWWPEWAK